MLLLLLLFLSRVRRLVPRQITPAHSVADYECAMRNGLPIRLEEGKGAAKLTADQVIALLTERGTYRGAKKHSMRVPICRYCLPALDGSVRASVHRLQSERSNARARAETTVVCQM